MSPAPPSLALAACWCLQLNFYASKLRARFRGRQCGESWAKWRRQTLTQPSIAEWLCDERMCCSCSKPPTPAQSCSCSLEFICSRIIMVQFTAPRPRRTSSPATRHLSSFWGLNHDCWALLSRPGDRRDKIQIFQFHTPLTLYELELH